MGDKPISFRDENGNFVSAADVWNAEKLEELFTRLNPNRKLRLEREKAQKKIKISESGTEIGNSLEFDFVVPPPHS